MDRIFRIPNGLETVDLKSLHFKQNFSDILILSHFVFRFKTMNYESSGRRNDGLLVECEIKKSFNENSRALRYSRVDTQF